MANQCRDVLRAFEVHGVPCPADDLHRGVRDRFRHLARHGAELRIDAMPIAPQ